MPDTNNRIDTPFVLQSLAMIGTVVVLLWLGWRAYQDTHDDNSSHDRDVAIHKVHADVTLYSEVLASSSLLTATTGNLKWETRYLSYEPRLARALDEAGRLAPGSLAHTVAAKRAVQKHLHGLDTQAFELVKEGQRKAAIELLMSTEYRELRKTDDQTTAQFLISRDTPARLTQLRGFILYLDEVLTMSARLAATTGDPRWVQRYDRHAPDLEAALAEALALAPGDGARQAARDVQAANRKLVSMEQEAFAYVQAGQLKLAQTAVFSDNYGAHKQIYIDRMDAFGAALDQSATAHAGELKQASYLTLAGLAFVLVIAIAGWLWSVRMLRERRVRSVATNRLKSEFLANMSHEIRTPLNAIIGMSELMSATALDGTQRDYNRTIRSSADSLLQTLNDILDFSKIEAGELEIANAAFSLHQVIEDVADAMTPRARDKRLDFLIRYDPTAPSRVFGDRTRIEQLVANLASNAIKFTKQGHVLLDVDCKEEVGDKAVFRISISDTGIGIEDGQRQRIFTKFSQGDASSTREYGGTGLGLAICKQLVELMGGEIGVKSKAGSGSTFWFELTLGVDPDQPEEIESVSGLTGLRVLIVDDNEVNRHILEERCRNWRLDTTTAADGSEALDCLKQAWSDNKPFQIALLDYHMPVMDGATLGRRIKADQRLQSTVLLLMSGSTDTDEPDELMSENFAAFVSKPIRPSILMDVLVQAWNQQTLAVPIAHKRAQSDTRPIARNTKVVFQFPHPLLVVEDNPTNQRVTKLMLEAMGADVRVAGHGRDALDLIKQRPFSLVFMDCQMPVLDGYEATREIRAYSKGKEHIPIVAMTAHAMQGDRERCLDAGMDDYISKPVRPSDLNRVLSQLVKGATQIEEDVNRDLSGAVRVPGEVFDFDEAVLLTGGTPELLGEAANYYFAENYDTQIERLEQAINDKKSEDVRSLAHSMKGVVAMFAAKHCLAAVEKLEQMGRNDELSRAPAELKTLKYEMERLWQALSPHM